MGKLQIYKASAGSGKTFLLTLTYLKSAFKYPDNFSKILAVTFTNKAAEEMKSRIISKLNELITEGRKSDFFSHIGNFLNTDNEEIIKERAKTVQDRILHNYSLFNVSTIDKFVQKIIRAFAFEMNLNSSYDIEFDQNAVIDDLTEKLFDTISENKNLQKWLTQFAEAKIEEGKNWDFKNELKNLAQEIFKENFQNIYNTSEHQYSKEELNKYLNEIYKIKNAFEKQMTDFAEQYKSVIEKTGVDYTSLGKKFMTLSNFMLKKVLKNKEYEKYGVIVLNCLNGFENWHNKTAKPYIIDTIKPLYDSLNPILQNYFDYFNENHEFYYSSIEIIKNFRSFGIINDISGFLPEYRRENNVLLISDTTMLLKKIIGNNDAPFIYEKIGNRLQHILIDEFQDTSGFQWQSFKPLIANSLSNNFDNLIVGDIKQSIYRWRGGDWQLLLSGVKKDIGEMFIEDKSLDTNWRSRENIIKFNNSLFEIIPELLQDQYNIILDNIKNEEEKQNLINQKYNRIITDAYTGQIQKIPKSDSKKGGKVVVQFYNKDEYFEKLSVDLPVIIENLLLKENKKPKDIGILVRTNKQAKEITEILTNYQNDVQSALSYKIISGEALYIENSKAVKIMAAAIKYLIDTNDILNTAELIFHYQLLSKPDITYNEVFLALNSENISSLLPEKFISEKEKLIQKELFELSELLINYFNLGKYKEEFVYIKTFQDQIFEQSKRKYFDLYSFSEWWEEKGKKTSVKISEKTNAVNIMTIHKSKGLAFDTVIVPYINYELETTGINASILWAKPEVSPFNNIKLIPVKYSEKLNQTIFRKDYLNEMLYSYTDALNMMYVAFTRAVNELYIFGQTYESKTNNKSIKDVGNALYNILSKDITKRFELKKYYQKEQQYFEFSENYIVETKKEEQEKILELKLNNYPNNDWNKKLKLKYASEEFMIESIPEIQDKVNYGKLMHSVFQEIITFKDTKTAVMKAHSEGFLSLKEAEIMINKINRIIKDKKVKSWFDGSYKVINEDAILTKSGDIKIPDRVMISDTEIIIIDFKFGKHRDEYKKQISEYQDLVKNLYQLPVKSFLFYPETMKIIPLKS